MFHPFLFFFFPHISTSKWPNSHVFSGFFWQTPRRGRPSPADLGPPRRCGALRLDAQPLWGRPLAPAETIGFGGTIYMVLPLFYHGFVGKIWFGLQTSWAIVGIDQPLNRSMDWFCWENLQETMVLLWVLPCIKYGCFRHTDSNYTHITHSAPCTDEWPKHMWKPSHNTSSNSYNFPIKCAICNLWVHSISGQSHMTLQYLPEMWRTSPI